jgi:hypothetical protein
MDENETSIREVEWSVHKDLNNRIGHTRDEFESNLDFLGTYVETNPELQSLATSIGSLKAPSNVRMFKKGASMKWEDYENGGQISMRLNRARTLPVWKKLVSALANREIPHFDHMVGIVLSLRAQSNAAHLWVKAAPETKLNQDILKFLGDNLSVHVVFIPFKVMKSRNVDLREQVLKSSKKVVTRQRAESVPTEEIKREVLSLHRTKAASLPCTATVEDDEVEQQKKSFVEKPSGARLDKDDTTNASTLTSQKLQGSDLQRLDRNVASAIAVATALVSMAVALWVF